MFTIHPEVSLLNKVEQINHMEKKDFLRSFVRERSIAYNDGQSQIKNGQSSI